MVEEERSFEVRGVRCAARLWRPAAPASTTCVVLAQGFSLTMDEGIAHYGRAFAAAGLHALAFDYRHFGRSGGRPRARFRIARQREDIRAALAVARGLDGVDPERVVAWGFSFGGGHVAHLAAAGERMAAALLVCPLVDGPARVRAADKRSALRAAPAALADLIGLPARIRVTGAPGERAAMTLPGEAEGFARVVAPGSAWDPLISPSALLALPALRPVARADRIAAPLWVGAGTRDTTVSGPSLERLATRAPRGELHAYATGHFGPLTAEWAPRIAADQLGFLDRHLLTGTR